MGWLLGPLLGGIVGGFVVVRILELLLGGVSSSVMNVLRPIFFVGTVTAATTTTGMSKFTSKVRRLKKAANAMSERLDAFAKKDRQ